MVAPFTPNPTRTQLRQAIQEQLNIRNWTHKDLAHTTGIRTDIITYIFNNWQGFMLHQLDAVTQALDLPAGHFYSSFKGECFNRTGKVIRKKCREFVTRCLEMGRPEIALDVADAILAGRDRKKQLAALLDIAETMFHSPLRRETLPLYERIIGDEVKSTLPIAVASYRRFLLVHYSTFEDWGNLLAFATQQEQFATHAGYTHYLAEALRYQVVAHRGLRNRAKAFEIVERLATMGDPYAKLAEEQRILLALEMGETECIPTWLANATTQEQIYQLLPLALHAYLDKGMVKEAIFPLLDIMEQTGNQSSIRQMAQLCKNLVVKRGESS